MIKYFKAFLIMMKAHSGQKDKGGQPYFLRPLRVSRNVKDKRAKIVALLHGVLENSDKYTFDDLKFLDDKQREALILLTHDKDEDYFSYVKKVKNSKLSREVKLNDLEDNMNLKRLKVISEKDKQMIEKYKKQSQFY